MTYTVTVHIAPRGTIRHNENQRSGPGHMFYTLHDGSNSKLSSYGFAPDGNKHASDGWSSPGRVYDDDYDNYDRNSTHTYTLEITKEQYETMMAFGANPRNYGFDMDYNGAANSCVDFTYKALEVAGLELKGIDYPKTGYQGKIYPHNNGRPIQQLFNPQLPNAKVRTNTTPLDVPGNDYPAGGWHDNGHECLAPWVKIPQKSPKYRIVDPLALDLDGNGIRTVAAEIFIGSVIGAVVCSTAIGVAFGFIPANKASKLNPIDALSKD